MVPTAAAAAVRCRATRLAPVGDCGAAATGRRRIEEVALVRSIDRATAEDLVSLATDVGSAPMQVGAVLLLDSGADLDAARLTATLADRIGAVPRLRQRLVRTPPGAGRPVWVDDADFDATRHITSVVCPAPGDEAALLTVAADVVSTRLPPDRPLWRMAVVTGLDDGRVALAIAFHHVLADGIGGLAVLAALVDGMTFDPDPAFPHPAPTTGALVRDAAATRLAALRDLPAGLGRVRAAFVALRPSAGARPTASSLNRPTGARRRFAVARADLAAVRRAAHGHGATVNDVVLAAVTGALHTTLAGRGESVDRFVVSVPVSARREATTTDLGNRVGVIPVELPGTGHGVDRLESIARVTREAKQATRAASTALLGPIFRLLARLGIFGWFIDRQRLVHTFVTNVRGPDARVRLLGAPVAEVIPLAVVTGNVTVSFAVLSYAGAIAVTVIADPDACPDLPALRDAVQHELDQLTGAAAT